VEVSPDVAVEAVPFSAEQVLAPIPAGATRPSSAEPPEIDDPVISMYIS
jgi:hypothetical protein